MPYTPQTKWIALPASAHKCASDSKLEAQIDGLDAKIAGTRYAHDRMAAQKAKTRKAIALERKNVGLVAA